jgi:hypothetical protein
MSDKAKNQTYVQLKFAPSDKIFYIEREALASRCECCGRSMSAGERMFVKSGYVQAVEVKVRTYGIDQELFVTPRLNNGRRRYWRGDRVNPVDAFGSKTEAERALARREKKLKKSTRK